MSTLESSERTAKREVFTIARHADGVCEIIINDPHETILSAPELEVRRALQLPPITAVAVVSGAAAAAYVDALRLQPVQILGPDRDQWLVKAPDPAALADALAAVPRPPGRLRVAVEPARL